MSACLAGEKVRYDGNHKRLPVYPLLNEELKLIPLCPEAGAGLGVPRPPVRLVKVDSVIHALGRDDTRLDVTAALQKYAEQSLQHLYNDQLLCGYLWKSRSPSCGLNSTPLFDTSGRELALTSGIHADYIRRRLPYIKHCDETALADETAAKAFVLQCRLVFDFLYGSNASLNALHAHYAFVSTALNAGAIKKLNAALASNNKTDYLTALLEACSQIPKDVLLRLFAE